MPPPLLSCSALNQTTGHSYTATVAAVGVRFIAPVAGLDKSSPYDLGATRLSLRSRPVCANPLWFDLVFNGERHLRKALDSIPEADLPASGTHRR